MEFSNKTVLITGAASGIGRLSAESFAKEGANVVLVDCNEKGLSDVKSEICAKGVDEKRLLTQTVDVTKYDEVSACRDKAVETFGSIDVLVTCAGGAEARLKSVSGAFYELPIEVMDFGIDLNLKGALYFIHSVMQQMVKQKSGVIIPLGSITGVEGCGTNIAYAASKSALMNGVVKSVARAGAASGIRTVCIAPGPVLTRPGMANMPTFAGRAAETKEIVDMILYVASEKGAFIDGTTFLLDGGRSSMYLTP